MPDAYTVLARYVFAVCWAWCIVLPRRERKPGYRIGVFQKPKTNIFILHKRIILRTHFTQNAIAIGIKRSYEKRCRHILWTVFNYMLYTSYIIFNENDCFFIFNVFIASCYKKEQIPFFFVEFRLEYASKIVRSNAWIGYLRSKNKHNQRNCFNHTVWDYTQMQCSVFVCGRYKVICYLKILLQVKLC